MTTDTEALRAQFELKFQLVAPSRNDAGDYTDRAVHVAWLAYQEGHAAAKAETAEMRSCHCATCLPINKKTRMVVCGICGNKRCPHATNHIFACTGSNDPGQPGNSYGTPLYTADQLAAAVAKERERCAAVVDRHAYAIDNRGNTYVRSRECVLAANAIRAGDAKEVTP